MPILRAISSSYNADSDIQDYFESVDKILTFIIFILVIKYLFKKNTSTEIYPNQDAEGFTQEDRILQTKIWDRYAEARLTGSYYRKLDNQTQLFFDAIRPQLRQNFNSSINQIIQFGLATGEYVIKHSKQHNRKVIGYDYSRIAEKHLKANGIETRCINLNARDSNNRLAYQRQLEIDFSKVSDVLFIRVLEYLQPETIKLLMVSLIALAKPGTKFYFENYSPPKNLTDPSGKITVSHLLKPGTISMFFAGRNDFKVEVLSDIKNPSDSQDHTVERLFIEKVRM